MKGKVSVAIIVVALGALGGLYLWAQSGGRIIFQGDHEAYYAKVAQDEESRRQASRRQASRTYWNDFWFRNMGGPLGSFSLPDEDEFDDFDDFDDLALPDPDY